ncbi:hypothetical protein AM493_12810 [Flavobacterium akiainvivens]|uniref:Uncharacterized protein n=2 Tax=Flavobacterium akiainvivens TaxID=1202724 RepID=A0A0N0RQT3_9FLAO|nr:hypothetical protein AM493_12810 [Flavobacterium akiainvivens]
MAQSSFTLPKGYVRKEIPKENSEELRQMNYGDDFSIRLENDTIKTFKTPLKDDTQLAFNNGLLTGSDHGEWGGKLIFKASGKETLIKKGNIFLIFELNGKVYFIEGLAHGILNDGAIYELKYSGNAFSYEKVFELPGAPEACEIVNNRIYIATFGDFTIINNWKAEYNERSFWETLYPNSLLIENENSIFVGLRGGIAHLAPQTGKTTLYVKN